MFFSHEEVIVRRGPRTGLPMMLAMHSSVLGQAVGGCRLWCYPRWQDGLDDAMRLSEGMSRKCAVAGLPNGGGKTVVAMPEGIRLTDDMRRDALHDVGDLVESFGGRYATGPDAGTSADDMVAVSERTAHVFCLPVDRGGSGDASSATAHGVMAALRTTVGVLTGSPDLAGRRFAVVGVGHVGTHLAHQLAGAGAQLVISDSDPCKKTLAERLGAEFLAPSDALISPVDVLVPAALGGILTRELIPQLRCSAVVGPANNQLADPDVADLLREYNILWAPGYVVNAGGVIHAVAREILGEDAEKARSRVGEIGDTLATIFEIAAASGATPAQTADDLARRRLLGAGSA